MSGFYPVGVILDALAVAAGGLIGAALNGVISEEHREKLNMVFGICSIAMGITSVVVMKNLPAVMISLIAGTVLGLCGKLERRLDALCTVIQGKMNNVCNADNSAGLITAAVLFCASGTGIYGSIVSGISGDHSILLSKAILDFFTAMIFACSLGRIVAWIAIPQAVILLTLFTLSVFIMPLVSNEMICDFKACGGIIMLATGFRILKLKQFSVTDMLPAMILIFPMSCFWTGIILPYLS